MGVGVDCVRTQVQPNIVISWRVRALGRALDRRGGGGVDSARRGPLPGDEGDVVVGVSYLRGYHLVNRGLVGIVASRGEHQPTVLLDVVDEYGYAERIFGASLVSGDERDLIDAVTIGIARSLEVGRVDELEVARLVRPTKVGPTEHEQVAILASQAPRGLVDGVLVHRSVGIGIDVIAVGNLLRCRRGSP